MECGDRIPNGREIFGNLPLRCDKSSLDFAIAQDSAYV
jgi:hypothetical protein